MLRANSFRNYFGFLETLVQSAARILNWKCKKKFRTLKLRNRIKFNYGTQWLVPQTASKSYWSYGKINTRMDLWLRH